MMKIIVAMRGDGGGDRSGGDNDGAGGIAGCWCFLSTQTAATPQAPVVTPRIPAATWDMGLAFVS